MSIGTLIKTIQDIMRKDVGVDGDAAVGLDHHETSGLGERGVQATLVDHTAAGHEKSHGAPN